MLSQTEQVRKSIELNLFFLRIMKEHLIFILASLTPRDAGLSQKIRVIKEQAASLLAETVAISNGVVNQYAIASGELVTPFTLKAENATTYYTGIPINTTITKAEMALKAGENFMVSPALQQRVCMLNQKAMMLTDAVIQSKAELYNLVSSCKIFVQVYPSLVKHVLEEAKMYAKMLRMLQMGQQFNTAREIAGHEEFWNHIMEEHALFIRGLLDPSEEKLIKTADIYAGEFKELVKKARNAIEQVALLPTVTKKSIEKTRQIRDFKAQGTQGILECKIKSIIIPLLSDHVLREANYYLRVLREFQER